MQKKLSSVFIILIIFSGFTILSYPSISNWYSQKYQLKAIDEYEITVENMKVQKLQEELEKAQAYNQALTGSQIEDPFIPGSGAVLPRNYTSILDINEGIMGYIDIPNVDIYLPIYHGTSETVLEKGVGHMEMTAFPIGGEGNHTVLTGHTALPGTLLFTNLRDVELQDVFYIHILNQVLAYEVDKISIIDPTDTSGLKPVKDMDYITLITCTPYGVNTHRLLVRGVRIPYDPEKMSAQAAGSLRSIPYNLIILITLLIITGILLLIFLIKKYKKKHLGGTGRYRKKKK